MGRIVSLVFLPVFIWLLVRGCKEIKRDYFPSADYNFLASMFWLFGIAYGAISLFLYAFFNASIVLSLKYW